MKMKVTIGAAMLLTLGSALAGGLMYSKEKSAGSVQEPAATTSTSLDVADITPELIAKWKATSVTADYSPPMLPI
jgi:hypothetical protein